VCERTAVVGKSNIARASDKGQDVTALEALHRAT
jgi:hypothetical protein